MQSRLLAGELHLHAGHGSPREQSRLHSQLECLLEEMRIKLSSVISDLLGISGYRILRALAAGETDPTRLAAWGDERLHCSLEQLIDALTGNPLPLHRQLLGLYLGRYPMIADPIAKLNGMVAEAMKRSEEAVLRLAEVPGLGADSAQQVIAEVGAPAS